jgi:hypothetical protein
MNDKNDSHITITTYDEDKTEHLDKFTQSWIMKIRQEFFMKMWELSTERREITRVFVKPTYNYGMSFEESIYLYKISSERTVFGHYKAYKKKLTFENYIRLMKGTEKAFLSSYKERSSKKVKTIGKKNVYQYYLFDLEPYTVRKHKKKKDNQEIEYKAKVRLREVAQDIIKYKRQIEKEDEYTFIKSFCHASYTPDKISPYIVFDDNGKLKKGCKKYWEFLKKEVSRLSNIPVDQLII